MWEGNINTPMSLNAYLYVYANPINLIDPSGYCANDDSACWAKARAVVSIANNIKINMGVPAVFACSGQFWSKHWQTEELEGVRLGLNYIVEAFDNDIPAFERAFGTVMFSRQWRIFPATSATTTGAHNPLMPGIIIITDAGASEGTEGLAVTVIHEMGHILDYREWDESYFSAPWHWGLLTATNGSCDGLLTTAGCLGGAYQSRGDTTLYGESDITEDFAESFVGWVILNSPLVVDYHTIDSNRTNYIQQVVDYYRFPQ